ncbi:MAG: hypothetical protein ACRC5M_03690 [Anaeroplasmataceae bacterium]
MVHLVYCDNKENVLENIISNNKNMVIRAATGRKIPHSRVYEGETLYFMKKGSGVINAKATVVSVQNYTKLSDDEIIEVLNVNQPKLKLTDTEKKRWAKKCICLIEFENTSVIPELIFDHQSNMDDWLIIEKIEDIVKGSSIPYNYDKSKF